MKFRGKEISQFFLGLLVAPVFSAMPPPQAPSELQHQALLSLDSGLTVYRSAPSVYVDGRFDEFLGSAEVLRPPLRLFVSGFVDCEGLHRDQLGHFFLPDSTAVKRLCPDSQNVWCQVYVIDSLCRPLHVGFAEADSISSACSPLDSAAEVVHYRPSKDRAFKYASERVVDYIFASQIARRELHGVSVGGYADTYDWHGCLTECLPSQSSYLDICATSYWFWRLPTTVSWRSGHEVPSDINVFITFVYAEDTHYGSGRWSLLVSKDGYWRPTMLGVFEVFDEDGDRHWREAHTSRGEPLYDIK